MTFTLNLIAFLVALYITLESISPIAEMPAGYKCGCLCHKLKYLMAISGAVVVMFYAWQFKLNLVHLALVVTVAFFIAPRTLYRFRPMWEIRG